MSRRNSDKLQRRLSTIYVRRVASAMKSVMYFAIVFAVLNFVNARPFPQFDGSREGLAARDPTYYRFPLFWYRRPFYDDDDSDIVNGGQVLGRKRKPSTVSYIKAGSGWGR